MPFRGHFCNFASRHPRDLILVSNSMFLGMVNQLGPFLEASDWPEGQEWDVGGPELWFNYVSSSFSESA